VGEFKGFLRRKNTPKKSVLKMFFEILYNKRMKITRLHHAYDFPEFKALATVRKHPQDTSAVVVTLRRPRKKKDQNVQHVVTAGLIGTTGNRNWSGTLTADPCGCILTSKFGAYSARSAIW